ncbi:MAG: Fe-S cluster assembly protein SufD [Lysobacter sp.]|nr:Fe-S cluster assembly protein SufD [Lysobacter sp.]
MSALLDSLASAYDTQPHRDDFRRAALDAALREGLPHARSEAWKYTPLRALERRTFAPADVLTSVDGALLSDIPSPRIVFVNGRFDPANSSTNGFPDGVTLQALSRVLDESRVPVRRFDRQDEVFARFNTALANEGVVLRIGAGVKVAAPIHLVFVGIPAASDQAWHLRHLIELCEGATATIVEHHVASDMNAHFDNELTQIHLKPGAKLTHLRVQDDATQATSILRTDVVLASGADYCRIDLELGASLSRHELNVRLEGSNARLTANGVLLATGRRHLDTRLGVEHIGRDTACALLWRGLGAGRSHAVFHGGITIHAGADGSDANLSNKNLLLSDSAEIDTQPVLEIHADEVKAAHGATVGRLDDNAMFYLRSRGLPEHAARKLLTAAFCREALDVIDNLALRESMTAMLDRRLAELEHTELEQA